MEKCYNTQKKKKKKSDYLPKMVTQYTIYIYIFILAIAT